MLIFRIAQAYDASRCIVPPPAPLRCPEEDYSDILASIPDYMKAGVSADWRLSSLLYSLLQFLQPETDSRVGILSGRLFKIEWLAKSLLVINDQIEVLWPISECLKDINPDGLPPDRHHILTVLYRNNYTPFTVCRLFTIVGDTRLLRSMLIGQK